MIFVSGIMLFREFAASGRQLRGVRLLHIVGLGDAFREDITESAGDAVDSVAALDGVGGGVGQTITRGSAPGAGGGDGECGAGADPRHSG